MGPWRGRLCPVSVDHTRTTRCEPLLPRPVMASGASRASAKGRFRTAHPVHIRQWVIENPPEHIYAKLVRRRDALDEAIRPAREALVEGSRRAAERLVRQLEGTAQPLPDAPREVDDAVARLIAANMVAAYWAEHPYDGARCLPSIMTVGTPWAVWPNMVHVLDLSPELIRLAIERGGSLDALDRDASTLHQAQPGLVTLHATAVSLVRLLKSGAVLVPLFQQALYAVLVVAHYAPQKQDAEEAARMATSLFAELVPDLSRHMTRGPDQLAQLQQMFQDTVEQATRLQAALTAEGATPRVVALARQRFGLRVDRRALQRWAQQDARSIARHILGDRLKKSRKTLQDQLRLAEQAQDIQESWNEFLTYFATLPDLQRRRAILLP